MRIAVDAMGGDHAPQEVVRGAVEGLAFLSPQDELVLLGDAAAIEKELAQMDGCRDRIRVQPTSQTIAMDEEPVEAVRRKRDSSIVRMIEMHARGEVDAVISAGNTGACAAGAQMGLRMIPGVSRGRAGIAIVLPSFSGPSVMCDVGANVSAKPHHLYQYALMGSIFAEQVLGIQRPKVGLLSVGEEEEKGNELVHKTRELIKADPFLNFVGNVEGRDLIFGRCANVVICDGFVGNVTLKVVEGLVEGLMQMLGKELVSLMPEAASKVKPVLKQIYSKLDYSEYGGAPLLGIDGVVLICHGRSDHRAIANAVRAAGEFVKTGVNKIITGQLAKGVRVGGED